MSTRGEVNRSDNGEDGLSLIELIVYVVLAAIILSGAAMTLINSWRTQENVTSVTAAANRGQVMGSAVERAMRNALAFSVSPDGTGLRVRTSLTGVRQCQGFQLKNGQGRIASSSGALPAVTSWGDWDKGIAQNGSIPFFKRTGDVVVYTFDIATSSAPVRFTGEAATRSSATGVTAPCWT